MLGSRTDKIKNWIKLKVTAWVLHSRRPNRNILSTDLKMIEGIILSVWDCVNGKRVTINIRGQICALHGWGIWIHITCKVEAFKGNKLARKMAWNWRQLTGPLVQLHYRDNSTKYFTAQIPQTPHREQLLLKWSPYVKVLLYVEKGINSASGRIGNQEP